MHDHRPLPNLSPREKQLLLLAADGLTDKAIAHELGISEATVGTYWGRVRIKLGPFSRTELVAIVMRSEQEAAVDAIRRESENLIHDLRIRAASGDDSFYRELLEHAPHAILLVSEPGSIVYGNYMASELFGYSQAELQDLQIQDLVPERFRAVHLVHRAEYLSAPERRPMGAHLATPALRKDGSEFLIRAALSSVPTPAGQMLTCAIRAADA